MAFSSPWNQSFATDYQQKGNYAPQFAYNPVNPGQMSSGYPNYLSQSYNRSPQPFSSSSSPSATQPQQENPMFYGYPNQAYSHNGPPQQTIPQYPTQAYSHNGPPQQTIPQQKIYQDPYTMHSDNHFDQQVIDRREQTEEDEDFPDYKELRNVFLRKQKEAEEEERRAQAISHRKSGPKVISKKPPPLPRKSSQRPTAQSSSQNVQMSSTSFQSPQNPAHGIVQMSNGTLNKDYAEIPVNHQTQTVTKQQTHTWQSYPESKKEMPYRPPMSINITPATATAAATSYDEPSPRVKIISNSPMSPQRATYRPDNDEGFIIARPRRHSVSISPHVTFMSSNANQPRRRTSYAEIMISGSSNSLPRNFTSPRVIQRSFSQISTDHTPDDLEPETFPSFTDVKQQFRQWERNETQQPNTHRVRNFGISYGPHSTQRPASQDGFTRISLRKSPRDGAQPPAINPKPHQRQMGWSATVQPSSPMSPPMISTGTNVQYRPQTHQQGKSAAHLQYNTPMGLYSVNNAKEALARDEKASELLTITGKQSQGPAIINSPTLQAVLKEDSVKRKTGHNPDVTYYHNHKEYGPGIGPLRQYEEIPGALSQPITAYNQCQDKFFNYPMWTELQSTK